MGNESKTYLIHKLEELHSEFKQSRENLFDARPQLVLRRREHSLDMQQLGVL